jgi:hypothetical protein
MKNRPERRPIALAVTSSVVALLTTLGHGALWANGRQLLPYRGYGRVARLNVIQAKSHAERYERS